MFIWKAMDGRKKNLIAVLFLLIMFALKVPLSAGACSCVWKGPFLIAAQGAPLVIVGKILHHHPGKSPTMDVLVLETLKGGILDSGMTIQMGDGMHCRPMINAFPVGTKWILAINGQGAKQGKGWAISHCGEYWLKVEGDYVVGSVDGNMKQIKKIPLQELKKDFYIRNSANNFLEELSRENSFVDHSVIALSLSSNRCRKDGKLLSGNSAWMKIWQD